MKVNSLMEWRDKDPTSYRKAVDLDIHRAIGKSLGWKMMRDSWDFESILEETRNFKNIAEWVKKSSGSYSNARINNWIQDVIKVHGWEYKSDRNYSDWTYSDFLAAASEYTSIQSWKESEDGVHQKARKLNFLQKISSDLKCISPKTPPGFWDIDTITEQAKKFNNLKSWGLGHPSSYKAAQERGIQREIGEKLGWFMQALEGQYTYEVLLRSASNYKRKADWAKNQGKFYQQANKLKVMVQIAAELDWKPEKIHWDFDKCKEAASKFKSLTEWHIEGTGSYKAASRLGIIREIANALGWPIRKKRE